MRHRRQRGVAPAVEAVAQEPAAPPPPSDVTPELVVTSHEVLFATASEPRCDACGAPLGPSHDGLDGAAVAADDEGFAPPGEGVYMWSRGDEVRFEKAPLCGACAAAIGMTALARWEIEEEEG